MALAEASVPRLARRSLALCWAFPAVSLALDVALVNLSFALAYWLRYRYHLGGPVPPTFNVTYQRWAQFEILISALMPASFVLAGIYRQRLGLEWLGEVFAVARAATVGMALAIIVTYLFQHLIDQHSRLVLIYTWILIIVLAAIGRWLTHLIMVQLHRRGWSVRRVMVAGSTPMGKMVMQNLSTRLDQGYHLVGFLHENGGAPEGFGRFSNLGAVAGWAEVIACHDTDEVVIALTATAHDDILAIRDHCVRHNVAFKIVPDLFEMSLSRVRMDDIAGIPLIDIVESPLRGANLVLKHVLDVAFAALGLALLSPLFALVALAIHLDSPGAIIIAQARVGRNGRTFACFKFRSMYQDAEKRHAELHARYGEGALMFKHKSDPRRTRVGRIIRKMSIDEMPNLLNVLRGEISLVGP